MVLDQITSPKTQVPEILSLSDDASVIMSMKTIPVKQKSDVATYQAGDKIIINFPSDFADFRESFISFTAQITTAGAGSTYDRFSNPIGCIFQRVRVYSGSQYIDDIDEYNVLRGIFRNAKPSAITNNTTEGSSTAAVRAAQSITSRQYLLKLEMDSMNQVLPLHFMSAPLRLELTLSDVASCLESDGTNPAYTLANVYYHYKVLDVPDSYNQLLEQKINSGGFVIPFRSWSNFDWSNLSGASAQIEIPAKYATCSRFYAVMRTLADTVDLTVDNKFTTFNPNDVDLLALKIGQRIYPSDKYDLSYDANKFELLETFIDTTNNKFHGRFRYGDILGAASWATDKMVMPFDLRGDISADESLFSNGVDTSTSGSSVVLQITLGSAPGSTQQLNTFMEYEVALKICAGGKVQIAK